MDVAYLPTPSADLPAPPQWPDLTPLWWVIGGLGGGLLVLLLLLAPVAVFHNGPAGGHARALFRLVVGVLVAGIDVLRNRRGCPGGRHEDDPPPRRPPGDPARRP